MKSSVYFFSKFLSKNSIVNVQIWMTSLLELLMLISFLIIYIYSTGIEKLDGNEIFSFKGRKKQKITLTHPKNALFKIKKMTSNLRNKNDLNQSFWYYVHFLTENIGNLQKYIPINHENLIIKNTYILFLNQDQIHKIFNISLIKMIEPNEKYFEDAGSIEDTNYLIVNTATNFDFSIYFNEDFAIEKELDKNSYIIKIINRNSKIIQYLCEIPEIKQISTYKDPVLANSLMTAYIQKNENYFKKIPNSQFYYLDRYLNLNGLTGKNEVISIIDSPIDFYHALFRDDENPVIFNKYMPEHRKISYYAYYSNMPSWKNEIMEYEHGTHVAGTAAGKSICTKDDLLGIFNGNAPDAKILYAGSNTVENLVNFSHLQILFNEINSRISSNSWGNNFTHPIINKIIGDLAQNNPNVAFIFSAGNDYYSLGNFSIRDPQGSKNVLTVGAVGDFYFNEEIFTITSIMDPDLTFEAEGIQFLDPWINATIGTEPGKTDILALGNNQYSCSEINKNNKFLLYGDDFTWFLLCNFTQTPHLLITNDATNVKQLLQSKSDISVTKKIKVNKNKKILRASFSSTGPARNGIIKPDVMAPGTQIISAKSRAHSDSAHGCGESRDAEFIFMNGTSMASPNVAGGAALIREYFNSGKWIDSVNLDGETTRALLINSCTHPLGSKIPDILYGHGIVDLSTVLPIENDFGVQISHQRSQSKSSKVLDEPNVKSYISENGHVVAKLDVTTGTNSKKLQITLSYIDVMLDMDTPIPITRDLDLIVTSPSNKIYFGDHLSNKDTQHLSTNEKVIIDESELEQGIYTIHVYGGNFFDKINSNQPSKQEFSVVASGPIKNGYLEFSDSSECPCDICDDKNPGYCFCENPNTFGQTCQINIEKITKSKNSFKLGPSEIKRVRFTSDKVIKKIFSTSNNPGKESTIWVSKRCHLALNEYEVNGYTEEPSVKNDGIDVNFGTKEVCLAIFNNNDREATYNIEISDGVTPTPKPNPTQDPEPIPPSTKCKDNSGSSSSKSKSCDSESSSVILGDFEIKTAYVGVSSILPFKLGYSIMNKARKIFGRLIPPPNFIHSAIWVGPNDATDETLGAIFVYGKYYPMKNNSTFLSKDGARSFVISLGAFKNRFKACEAQKIKPRRTLKLFDYIKEVKSSGKWTYDNYNWPTNNCQHFTAACLNILKAVRYSKDNIDWISFPDPILKTLKLNE